MEEGGHVGDHVASVGDRPALRSRFGPNPRTSCWSAPGQQRPFTSANQMPTCVLAAALLLWRARGTRGIDCLSSLLLRTRHLAL
jgi:hypothetical protein